MSVRRKIFTAGLVGLAITTPLLAVPAHAATTLPASAIAAQPLNVVAIGDSYASGEGDIGSGWVDSTCQRSAGAAPERAADLLGGIQPVSFTSFACYGSVIESTTVNPAQTLLGNGGLNGQLYAVDPGRNTPVDALTISIGGNDINFATIVLACMAPFNSCSTDPTVNTMVTGGLNLLGGYPSNPGELGDLIKAVNARTDIDNVFLTEYPDPTTGPYGAWCGSGGPYPGFGGLDFVSQADAIWASEHVIQPLNAALQSAVAMATAQRGPRSPVWHYLSGMYNAFYGHGYCTGSSSILLDSSPNATAAATPRYVNTLADSEASQGDQNGTMHPNDAGQQAMAEVIYHDYLSTPLMSATVSASFPPVAGDTSLFTIQARTFAGTPVADASVVVDGNLIGHTGSNGVLDVTGYVFSAAGNHTIVVQAAGYPDAQAVLAVQPRSYSAVSSPSPIPLSSSIPALTLTASDGATGQVVSGTFTLKSGAGTLTLRSGATASNVPVTMGSKTVTITVVGPDGKPHQVTTTVPVCPTLTFQPDSAAYTQQDFSRLISCTANA
jgi:lysophospholipase L1-like esterase